MVARAAPASHWGRRGLITWKKKKTTNPVKKHPPRSCHVPLIATPDVYLWQQGNSINQKLDPEPFCSQTQFQTKLSSSQRMSWNGTIRSFFLVVSSSQYGIYSWRRRFFPTFQLNFEERTIRTGTLPVRRRRCWVTCATRKTLCD